MSVKQDVLKLLEEQKGRYLSGEELAERLSVSRTAVWKAMENLRKSGYQIDAATRKGYCLASDSDQLSVEGILPHLRHREIAGHIHTMPICESTNLAARKLAVENEQIVSGTTIISEAQTGGRGRLGRSFFSPAGSGIYLSMVLRPHAPTETAMLITTAASVAVCRAIRRMTEKEPQIKWVNDLFLDGKKICGISAEGMADLASGTIGTVILGIGINFTLPAESIPEPLRPIIGFLYESETPTVTKNELIAALIDEILDLIPNLSSREFLEDYRRWSFILGQKIRILPLKPGVPAEVTAAAPPLSGVCDAGTAEDIDSDGSLLVRMDDGTLRTLRTGEISIRPIQS